MAVATQQHSARTAPRHVSHSHTDPSHPRPTKQRFVAGLSQYLFDFVVQLLPTADELAVKEDVRKLLERLIRTIEPDSRLLSFGSTANGFSLRNSGEQPLPTSSPAIRCLPPSPTRYGPLLFDRFG
jgi:DNA polymerase sigma